MRRLPGDRGQADRARPARALVVSWCSSSQALSTCCSAQEPSDLKAPPSRSPLCDRARAPLSSSSSLLLSCSLIQTGATDAADVSPHPTLSPFAFFPSLSSYPYRLVLGLIFDNPREHGLPLISIASIMNMFVGNYF